MEVNVDKNKYKNLVEKEYINAKNNDDFNALVKKIKLTDEQAKNNTLKLLDTLEELSNCKNCKSLYECKNRVKGHVYFPEIKESKVVFSYIPCKYQKKEIKNSLEKETNDSILNSASFKGIKEVKNTKGRMEVIKKLKEYFDNYDKYKTSKGIYLHGNFGTGKTYLICALLNELKNKYNISVEMVYVPELLRKLKENLYLVGEKTEYLENVDILFLDDIGAEKVTEWGRDEILGTILQTRMNKKMPTFFTSNLNINELEHHLSVTKEQEDAVKAKRLIERVKALTEDIELLGNNYRD